MKSMILLCVCTVLVSRLETSAGILSVQGPHHHPIYKYSCNEDLSVTFKGVNGTIQYFSGSAKPAKCEITNVPGHEANFKISKECLLIQSFKLKRTMKIAVYDKNEEEHYTTTPKPTPTLNPTATPPPKPTTPMISGGHHIFEITCLPLKTDGVERIALAETGITDIEKLHHVYNEIGQVEMWFKEGESLDKPDLSEVYIGDRFYMYLKYMGDTTQYTIMPQSCTAYKGTFRNNKENEYMELWKNTNTTTQCLTTDAQKYNVMKNFKRLNDITVHAELLGFRFSPSLDGGSSDVTIACTVQICTSISVSGPCKDNCAIPTASYRRRKRETGTVRSQVVSKTLKVRNQRLDSNNAGKNGLEASMVGIIIALIFFHRT